MAKFVYGAAGSLLVQFAFTTGEVVELDNGPTPVKHLQSIGYIVFAVLV